MNSFFSPTSINVCLLFRLFVECRYVPGSVSVSYMVKTPTLGPAVHSQGVFGVQLRIAKGRVLDSETRHLALVLKVKFLSYICLMSLYYILRLNHQLQHLLMRNFSLVVGYCYQLTALQWGH